MMTTGLRSQFGYWDSLAISHRASLYTPKVLSLEFSMYSFGAGAAHGYAATKTMNFQLRPSRELHLTDVFNSSTDYLGTLSGYCLEDLCKQQTYRRSDYEVARDQWKEFDDGWLSKGAEAKISKLRTLLIGQGRHDDPFRSLFRGLLR